MKPISGKQFAAILEGHGWVLMRIRGSHHIYGKPGVVARLSVPVHGKKDLKTESWATDAFLENSQSSGRCVEMRI